jgi:CRISPR-associated protein (TIGR03984 family)
MAKMREIKSGGCQMESVDVSLQVGELLSWLVEQARTRGVSLLLAHADDGVIWGRVENESLLTAAEVFAEAQFPPLRLTTLQQARLFGPAGELLLWRSDPGWCARWVTDGPTGDGYYDEAQMLWGTQWEGSGKGFTLVHEGRQGLRHAPPIEIASTAFDDKGQRRPLRLQVRHYLANDADTGLSRHVLSRLVNVTQEEQRLACHNTKTHGL